MTLGRQNVEPSLPENDQAGDATRSAPSPKELREWIAARIGGVRDEWFKPSGLAASIAVAGVAAYVWIRLAADIFYGSLGASPEEFGLRYPTVLAQAAYGLFVWFVILLVLVALLLIPAELASRLARRPPMAIVVGIASTLLAVALLRFLFGNPVAAWRTLAAWALLAFTTGYVVFALVLFRRFMAGAEKRVPGGLGGALVALAAAIAVLTPLSSAAADAKAVRSGSSIVGRLFGASFFPWRPEAARVEWSAGKRPSIAAAVRFDCVIYLGDSPRGAVIYTTDSVGARQLFHIPQSAGTVVIWPDATGCPDWPRAKGTSLF